jgi:bifunctional DNA-binding transcriptional regulator/antitoxin component of YhaV-PrlF toxin-antitoxin module
VVPANLRKRYGLTEGTTVVFHEDSVRLVLAPSNHQAIYTLQVRIGRMNVSGIRHARVVSLFISGARSVTNFSALLR